MWYKYEVPGPFSVGFKYKAGGGTGADGFVVLFYQKKAFSNVGGLLLATSQLSNGYGIEFDNYGNSIDPSSNHIALKDKYSNHLVYVNDLRTEDFIWHYVNITVGPSSVNVFVDSIEILSWQGELDRTNTYFGFAGACGADTNWHIIDEFSLVLLEPSIEEPYIKIDQAFVSDDRADIGTTQAISFHAKWDNGTDVVNGKICIDSTNYSTDSSGWMFFNHNMTEVGSKSWKVTGVNCGGVTRYIQTTPDPTIICDQVQITLALLDKRIDVDKSFELTWTGVYLFDYSEFKGEIYLEYPLVEREVGRATITVANIFDQEYGLNSFTSNSVYCIWDRIKIVEGEVNKETSKVGDMETVWFKVVYEFDEEEFTDQDGVIYVNNIPMSWSSHDRRWKYSTTLDEPGSIVFEITGIDDNKYGLSVIKDTVGPLTIEWERQFWETPVGIMSIGALIVVLVSVVIFFLRKRIARARDMASLFSKIKSDLSLSLDEEVVDIFQPVRYKNIWGKREKGILVLTNNQIIIAKKEGIIFKSYKLVFCIRLVDITDIEKISTDYRPRWFRAERVKFGDFIVSSSYEEKLIEFYNDLIFPQVQRSKGLVEYKGNWMTSEDKYEKEMLEKGFVKYKDQWVTLEKFEDEQKDKGLVKFMGRWGTPKQVDRWKKIYAGLSSDFLDRSPREFEEFITELFTKMGYSASTTSISADYGADVIAKKDNENIAIQVKRYKLGNKVGVKDVNQVLGSMYRYNANKAIMITTSYFTSAAKKLARTAPVELWNRTKLYEMIERYFFGDSEQSITATIVERENEAIKWGKKAYNLYNLGKYEDAIESYEWFLELAKDFKKYEGLHKEAWNNIGVCLIKLGKVKEAIEYFDKVLEIDPEYQLAKNNKEIARARQYLSGNRK